MCIPSARTDLVLNALGRVLAKLLVDSPSLFVNTNFSFSAG